MLDIAERSEGKVKLSPGTLYGSIKQMLEEGLIEEGTRRTAADDDRRRYYRITRAGREAAQHEMRRRMDPRLLRHYQRIVCKMHLVLRIETQFRPEGGGEGSRAYLLPFPL